MKRNLSISVLLMSAFMITNFHTSARNQLLAPDLIITNAIVHTMDTQQPTAQAVAIQGNRIVAVGSNEEVRQVAGAHTRVIDARGKLVLPGFNDAHVHFLSGGFQLSSVDLRDANSTEEFADRIRRFAEKLPAGRWLTGGDWDHERWPSAPLPTKELIDRYTPNTPVFVNRLDGHMALANSVTLKLAGVTRETKNPPGGLIVRDAKTGEPTGILKDAAMSYVWRVVLSRALLRSWTPRGLPLITLPASALLVCRICRPERMSAFIRHCWIEAN